MNFTVKNHIFMCHNYNYQNSVRNLILVLALFIISAFLLIYLFQDSTGFIYDSNHVHCNGTTGNNNFIPSNQSFNNPNSNFPGGNGNSNHNLIPDKISSDEDDKYLFRVMAEKLDRYRTSCAGKYTNGVYDTTLDNSFSPQEHEYICDKVTEYTKNNPSSLYLHNISGKYPDRIYNGRISIGFINKVFGPK